MNIELDFFFHHFSEYYEDVHRVIVPKPMEGEKLGLTVQQSDGCVVVTRLVYLNFSPSNIFTAFDCLG